MLEAFLKHLVILFSTSALIVVKYTIYKTCHFTMFVSIHCSGIKHIHIVVPLPPSMGRTFSATQSEILYLLNHTPPFPFYLAPDHHCSTFFLWNLVTLRTCAIIQYLSFSCFVHFTQHKAFKVHPGWSMCQNFITFQNWVITHGMSPSHVYPFTHLWAARLLPCFSYCE